MKKSIKIIKIERLVGAMTAETTAVYRTYMGCAVCFWGACCLVNDGRPAVRISDSNQKSRDM